jgi:hypothetical protein
MNCCTIELTSRHTRFAKSASIALIPIAALVLTAACSTAQAQTDSCRTGVRRVTCENPIAGFSISIPEDWEVATAAGCNIEIAIDAPTGASITAQPALWFFYSKNTPKQTADDLAKALTAGGGGSKAEVRPAAKPDEFEVVMASAGGAFGKMNHRWLCRSEKKLTYVIGAMARPEVADAFKGDIDAALSSCKLIEQPVLRFFRDPDEDAYRIVIPDDWTWVRKESLIYRSEMVPGYFVWKVQRPDALAGCWVSPPSTFNVSTPYTAANKMAGTVVLQALRGAVPDLKLEGVKRLTGAEAYFLACIKALGPTMNPSFCKVLADYTGTVKGAAVRIRIVIVTLQWDASAMLGGAGDWEMHVSGVWAPKDNFDKLYPLGRGIISSLRTSPEWKRRQLEAVNAVLKNRRGAAEEAFKDWDAYIRDMERVKDPHGGPPQEVPMGDGKPWMDGDGKMRRVPPGQEAGAKDKGWTPVE